MSAPRVSVLMGVRDGAAHVREAVDSILAQTLADLELIVVDDGSTDGTVAILSAVRDPRVRVERRPPEGLTRALNHALGRARAPLVARLDADDVARPERLAPQPRGRELSQRHCARSDKAGRNSAQQRLHGAWLARRRRFEAW